MTWRLVSKHHLALKTPTEQSLNLSHGREIYLLLKPISILNMLDLHQSNLLVREGDQVDKSLSEQCYLLQKHSCMQSFIEMMEYVRVLHASRATMI